MNNIFINLNSFKQSIYIEKKDIFLMNLYHRKKNINLIIKKNKSFSYNNQLPSLIINNKSNYNNNNKIDNDKNKKIKIKNDILLNNNKKNYVINKKNISRNIYLYNNNFFINNNKDMEKNKKNIDNCNDFEKCLKIFNISSRNLLQNKLLKIKNSRYNNLRYRNEMASQTNLYYKINIKNNKKKNNKNISNSESKENINKSFNDYIYHSIYYKSK